MQSLSISKMMVVSIAVVVFLMPTQTNAQWWNPSDPMPEKQRNPEAANPFTYTRESLNAASMVIQMSLEAGNWGKLETMHNDFLKRKSRATDGTWMVESFQWGFDAWFASRDMERCDRLFRDWKDKMPESRLRPLAEAAMWQRQAWSARGGRFASTVPGESQQIFRERLKLAQTALDNNPDGAVYSPIWHWVALIVAGSTGQPKAEFEKLFDQAVAKFPAYQSLYFTRANYLLPQWGGNFKALDNFIRASAAATAATEGAALYAWLYVDASRKLDADLFSATQISWPMMKQSFEDMTGRFPDAWNKNLFATFACRARDRETTKKLLNELGPKAQLGIWSSGVSTESCRRLVGD